MAKNLRKYKYMKYAWVCLCACLCLYFLKHLFALWPFPKEEPFTMCGCVLWGTGQPWVGIGIRKGGADGGAQAGGGSTEAGDCNDGGGEECIWGRMETIGGKKGKSSGRPIMNSYVTVPRPISSWARFPVVSSSRPRISYLKSFSTGRSLSPISFLIEGDEGRSHSWGSPTCTQSGSLTHACSTNGLLWLDWHTPKTSNSYFLLPPLSLSLPLPLTLSSL